MQPPMVKFGYVVEGDRAGYFYHRMGLWTQYKSPADGYVWSDVEVAGIRDASEHSSVKWEIKPAKVHPALYDDNSGVTVITGTGVSLRDVSLPPSNGVNVPTGDGKIFDISSIAARLGGNQVIVASNSL